LIRATADLLQRHGYGATGLDEILEAASATNGSLYHHFPGGKEELAVAAIRASGARVEADLRARLAGGTDLGEALETWIDGLARGLEADPLRGCPVAPTALESPGVGDRLREAADRAFEGWRAALEEALGRTMPVDRAAVTARALLAAIEGALLLDRTGRRTDSLAAVRALVPALLGH
jgi:TetR/AcrR family transcriptional repressor of lmrAB and yxaGH operons